MCKRLAYLFFWTMIFFQSPVLSMEQESESDTQQSAKLMSERTWSEKFSFKKSINILSTHQEVLNLLGSLMHIPYILTVDSTNYSTIKTCTALATIATSIKTSNILLGHDLRFKVLTWDAPKMACYLLSIMYDMIRFFDATKIAYKNETENINLKGFKINQLMQLSIEIILRIIAIISEREKPLDSNNSYIISTCASELADLVGIWRLLGRYVTYFTYTDSLEITLSIHKKQISPDVQHNTKELDDLDAIAKKYDIIDHNALPVVEANDTQIAVVSDQNDTKMSCVEN